MTRYALKILSFIFSLLNCKTHLSLQSIDLGKRVEELTSELNESQRQNRKLLEEVNI
jgi:hypothetical protein